MRKQINNLIIALAFISTLGCLVGCVKKEREKSRQAQTVTSSTTKEDKEAIKQKQLAYLKEHEKEIVDFVKAQNPKVESVQIDWNCKLKSLETERLRVVDTIYLFLVRLIN